MAKIEKVVIIDLYQQAKVIQEICMPYLDPEEYEGLEHLRNDDPIMGIRVIDTVVERVFVRHASVRRRFMERQGRTPIDELSAEYIAWRDETNRDSLQCWDSAIGALMRPEKRGGIALVDVTGYNAEQIQHWDRQPGICQQLVERYEVDPSRRTVNFIGFSTPTQAAFSAYSPDFLELVDQVLEILQPVLIDIGKILGDHYWTMFSRRWIGTDLHVEQGIDYRIYDWNRRMSSGQWEY